MPSFSYPGGKVRLRKWLVSKMPFGGRWYVEPFAGRANVFWLASHVLGFQSWHLNDPETERWLEAVQVADLRSVPPRLTKALVRMYWQRARDHRAVDDVAVLLEPLTHWAGGAPESNPRAHLKPLSEFLRRVRQARQIIASMAPRITGWNWRDCNLCSLCNDDFVYLDPPYLNARIIYYENKVDHEALLKYLADAPHLWMISGYPSDLYSNYLGTPVATKHVPRIACRTTSVLTAARVSVDCVWTNYTLENGVAVRRSLKPRRIRKRKLS